MARGRPARIDRAVEVRTRIPKALLDAAKNGNGCSDADVIRKAVKFFAENHDPESVESIGLKMKDLKKTIAKNMRELSTCRKKLEEKGMQNVEEFEHSLMFEEEIFVEERGD